MPTYYMTAQEAGMILSRMGGHFPALVATESVMADWTRLIRSTPDAEEVARRITENRTAEQRAPKMGDWNEIARQVNAEARASGPPAITRGRCASCGGTGWIEHTSGEHQTFGNTLHGPVSHVATPQQPIMRRCTACESVRNERSARR